MTLGKRSDYGDSRFVGVEVEFTSDVQNCLQECDISKPYVMDVGRPQLVSPQSAGASIDGGFDFILASMVHPDRRPPPPPAKSGDPITPMFKPDQALTLPSQ
eukprot:236164-Pyramimonas_sp.AAC.1